MPVMAENDVIITGLYPLAILARFFGYFPFSNFGTNVNSSIKLRRQTFRLEIFITLFSLTTAVYENYIYYQLWPLLGYRGFNDIATSLFCNGYRLSCFIIYCNFILKNSSLVLYFQRCHSECQFTMKSCEKKLKMTGYALVFILVIIVSVMTTLAVIFFNRMDISILEKTCALYISILIIFTYAFTAAFIVYMNFAFVFAYDCLTIEMSDLLEYHSNGVDISHQLGFLRKRHEEIVLLVEELNSILFVIVPILVSSLAVGICFGLFDLLIYVAKTTYTSLKLTRIMVQLLIRIIPLTAVCITSSMVTEKVTLPFEVESGYCFWVGGVAYNSIVTLLDIIIQNLW
ncbi:hypothetical protein CHUAL_007061 [Chamberlinius hualienensis]